jgi:CO/xanthine dehydrogenase FAD-binding subunit
VEISRPDSLEEALAVLADDPAAVPLAGGTDLMVGVNFGIERPQHVVSLRRVAELRRWDDGFIGAGVTYGRLEKDGPRGLAEAARTVGSPQIRSAGTIGGNLGTASPAGDAVPFLAAVDAEIEVASAGGGIRRMPWYEFLVGPKKNALQPGELILGVRLPELLPAMQGFAKVGVRNAMVIAVASACLVREEDGTTRVALGSVGPTVVRARRAEEMISAEARPSPAAAEEFGRMVAAEVSPITDHRSTEAYRRHASGVLARRLLERAVAA